MIIMIIITSFYLVGGGTMRKTLLCLLAVSLIFGMTASVYADYQGSFESNLSLDINSAMGTSPVYRFWSNTYMHHFYTISETDKNYVIATWPTVWTYEGPVFNAFTSQVDGTLPVYRFWSDTFMGHFYTISEIEKNYVIATWPDTWTYEGPVYYAYPTQVSGTSPVYRFWSNTFMGHFYTISETEKNYVIATWPDTWTYEGPVFYAYQNISTSTINLPKTGQTTSYYPGDDGDLERGVAWPNPRFTVSDDCVTDNLTGLMWAKNANLPNGTKTWQEALDYIASMNSGAGLCGYHDWHLPNKKELKSIVDYSKYNPALPADKPFINVQSFYWSSTTFVFTDQALVSLDGHLFQSDKSHKNHVWPVRAGQIGGSISLPKTGQTKCYNSSGTEISCTGTGQDGEIKAGVAWPNPRFTSSGDCVTDNLTDLMWAKNANLAHESWQEALDYVASLNSDSGLCGYHDWRLPNVTELESIVNAGEVDSSTWLNAQGFINVQSNSYWSSTTDASSIGGALSVDMFSGGVYYDNSIYSHYVWPVRAGQ
jgi:hypothetical protein